MRQSVAVIIPTYRPGKYLYECLNSINEQTLGKEKFRVYICLNGDKDPYERQLREGLRNCEFDYELILISDSGVSRARNALLDKSKEEFVVFIDDDDVVSKDYLEGLLNVTSCKVMGIARVCCFCSNVTHASENYIGTSFAKLRAVETSKVKSRKYFSSPCGKMLSREMIGGVRFDQRLSKGEDALFMAMIAPNIAATKKAHGESIYYVRERPGSLTRRKIGLSHEWAGLSYLLSQYFQLFFKGRGQRVFVLTRLVAISIHFCRSFWQYVFIK